MPLLEWLSYIITLLGLVIIIAFVGARNLKSPINRRFTYFALSVLAFAGTSFVSELARPLNSALLWTRLSLMVANFIPLTFFLFTEQFTSHKLKYHWVRYILIVIPILLVPLSMSALGIETVKYDVLGTSIDKTGPLLILELLYFVVAFSLSFRILHQKSKVSVGSDRTATRLIIYGVGATVALNLLTQLLLPLFGLTIFGDIFGMPSVLILVVAVGYAIARHGLFDIKAAALRSLVYVLGIITVIFFYSIVVYLLTLTLFRDVDIPAALAIYFVGSSIVLAIFFQPMIKGYQKLTDKLFYRDRYDPQILINQVSSQIAGTIILEELSARVLDVMQKSLRLSRADLLVLNEEQVYFSSAGILPEEMDELQPHYMSQFPDKFTLADMIEYGKRRDYMARHEITALVKLVTNQRVIGYLLLGDKLSGYTYNNTDIAVLETISTELAVAIENALSYAKISHFNETLQVRIAHATQELTTANEKLRELDRAKDEFISMTSHQLRTPISIVTGYLSLVMQHYYGDISDRAQATLEKALDSANYMGGIVNDLLNISRMDAGKLHYDRRESDLELMIAREVENMQLRASKNGTTLLYHPPKVKPKQVLLDPEKTHQVVANLIDNAIFYTPNGKVEVFFEQVGDSLVFKVIDNGIGVPEAQKAKLFTRFFRADNARDLRPDGTGLGLYLVKRIVTDQGGSIIFESQVGHGSTFGFRLPVHPPEVLQPASMAPAQAPNPPIPTPPPAHMPPEPSSLQHTP